MGDSPCIRLIHASRYIDLVPNLPKTPTGKIQKYELRAAGCTSTTWDREAAGIKLKR